MSLHGLYPWHGSSSIDSCFVTFTIVINFLSTKLLLVCVQIFPVNVLSTSGTPCLMMSVSTLFIGLDVVSCVLICLVILGTVLGLVDFHFLSFILRVSLILSRLIKATISVFFVPCCPVVLSFYLVLSYMFELNKWRWRVSQRIKFQYAVLATPCGRAPPAPWVTYIDSTVCRQTRCRHVNVTHSSHG